MGGENYFATSGEYHSAIYTLPLHDHVCNLVSTAMPSSLMTSSVIPLDLGDPHVRVALLPQIEARFAAPELSAVSWQRCSFSTSPAKLGMQGLMM
jgi:hypothetical protein